ncbi:MAG: protein-L-isoaspartate O-methyltransferase, partial [Sphingomonadaceae bacterium]|nr:protein-L-isoaspartate O-methyltransferase [Sphingomonadaceae bacterium]
MKGPSVSPPDLAAMRDAMVESQLRTTGVGDARLLAAIAAVPREAFVPPEKAALAYADLTLPLGGGREMNLPMTTAQLLDRLALGPDDAVLVIGGAYAAAVAVRLAARVVALEDSPALAANRAASIQNT